MDLLEMDREFILAAAVELEGYLLSAEKSWPLGREADRSGKTVPLLTPGTLLLAMRRQPAVQVGSRKPELGKALEAIAAIRLHWQAAWKRKAMQELSGRIAVWGNFLSDLAGDPAEYCQDYAIRVCERVICELLMMDGLQPEKAEQDRLCAADDLLRRVTHPGSFVWLAELQPGFPAKNFWFLYQVP